MCRRSLKMQKPEKIKKKKKKKKKKDGFECGKIDEYQIGR